MRVSVIIPTYNSGPLVVEAVDSVLAQTRQADEIIVVDDGSTDDTAERLARFEDRIRYIRRPNGRVAAARNTGLRLASGEVIAFLDADDAWHPCKLERQLEWLQRRPELGLLATRLCTWPGEFSALDEAQGDFLTDLPLTDMLVWNPLATSSILVRRSVLRQAGEFDEELFGPEDYDLWLRCVQLAPTAILEEPLTGYRDVSGSVGKQAESMRRGLLRIHAKLSQAGVWKSQPWLQRKSRAHVDYTTGFLMLAAGKPRLATGLAAHSLVQYPLPMSSAEVRYRCGRLRLLLRSAAAGISGWLTRRSTAGPA